MLRIAWSVATASEINDVILTSQNHEKDPEIHALLKMLIWTQKQLDEKAIYPHINYFSTATLEDTVISGTPGHFRSGFATESSSLFLPPDSYVYAENKDYDGYHCGWALAECLSKSTEIASAGGNDSWKCQIGVCGEANLKPSWVTV